MSLFHILFTKISKGSWATFSFQSSDGLGRAAVSLWLCGCWLDTLDLTSSVGILTWGAMGAAGPVTDLGRGPGGSGPGTHFLTYTLALHSGASMCTESGEEVCGWTAWSDSGSSSARMQQERKAEHGPAPWAEAGSEQSKMEKNDHKHLQTLLISTSVSRKLCGH